MNYAGKFGASGLDSLSSAHVDIDSLSQRGHSADAITVPDAHLLFSGDFHKSGSDLIISDDIHRVVVPNYFHGDKRPTLVSPEGAPLDPKVIEALAGHTAYAQAGNAPAAKVVGHVAAMTGSASIVRNGVTIVLNNGDAVYQSDVVQTGSSSTLGLVLIDGTTFNLTANARLMLNDLTYEATSTSNSSLFTLVQGAASFVAGQVAKTGDMKVATPVATMGIRGTAVILDISSVDGKVSISVVDQHDGLVHAVQVFNARGDLIGMVTSNGTSLTLTPTATFEVIAQESNKTVAQIAQEFNAFQQVLNTYDIFKAVAPDTPPPTDGKRGDAAPQSNTKIGGTITPSNQPTLTPDTSPGAKITTVAATGPDPVNNPPTSSPTPTTKVEITTDNGVHQQEVTVPAPSVPFAVTAPTVTKISSGPGNHSGPVMSADGRFVTYDPDGAVYLFDSKTGTTITIQAPAGGFTFGAPTISADGHFIVYQRSDGVVFLYNNNAADNANYHHITQLVAGTSPAINGDGSVIVVEQGGSSLGGYDQQGHLLFTITPASVGASGAVWKPAISADGHLVAFWNSDAASAGGTGHLFTFDRSTGVVTQIAATASGAGSNAASISADGQFVTYQSDSSGHSEIYLYSLTKGQVIFHTANASGGSYNPVISPDGHFIIFASDAKLTADDQNSVADTYVVDVTDPNHPSFKLVSVGAGGAPGDAASNLGGAISTGGKLIVFASNASNFGNGDDNGSSDIFVVDPSSGRNVIITEDSLSPSVLTANGTIAVEGVGTGATISVSDPSRFSATLSADGKSIEWNFHEAKSDFASLAYGQNADRPLDITLSSDGGTLKIPVTVTIQGAVLNSAPVINSATLTVSEGDTVVFGPANIGISDADDLSFTFKVTGVSHGQFQVFDGGQWKNTATFTSAELAGGLIQFIHDGSEFAPIFSIQADDGETANHRSNILAGTVNFTHVNDAPQVTGATIVAGPGATVVLGAANLNITHTDSFADFSGYPTRADLPAFSNDSFSGSILVINGTPSPGSLVSVNDPDSSSFTFKVTNVSHGVFQTYDGDTWNDATAFTSADLNAGHVRFVREDSADTPTFSIQVDDGAAVNHASSVIAGTVSNPAIVIDFIPVITAASLTVSEGGTILVAPADIALTDPDDSSFTFTVTNVAHGTFQTSTDGIVWAAGTQFTTADLNAHHVRFVHDGGEAAPTFSIQANDGIGVSNVLDGSVTFTNVNDKPAATPVVLTAGTEDKAYTIYAADLLSHVTDPDGPFPLSITDLCLVSGGGVLVDNDDGRWTYTPAHNYNGPVSFNYKVTDGSLTSHSTASLTLAAVNDAPTVSGPVTGTATENGTPGFLNALTNASDPDGDTLQVVNLSETLPVGVAYSSILQGFILDPSNAAFQHLAVDESTTVTVNYDVSDGHLTVPGSVSWIIHGINEAPTVTPLSGSVTEEDDVQVIDLLAGARDVDTSDTLSVTNFAGTAHDQDNQPVDVSAAVVVGPSTVTVDPHDFDYLGAGQSVALVAEYDVSDGHTVTHNTATLIVNGVNDTATITGNATGLLVEDSTPSGGIVPLDTASGVLTVHDVDSGENHFAEVDSDALAGKYGQFTFDSTTGAWTYQVDSSKIQSLGWETSATDTLTVVSADGTAHQDIVVTIDGRNDAATITGNATGHLVEDGTASGSTVPLDTVSGALTVNDVDSGENHFGTPDPEALAGNYGQFTFNSTTGAWTYHVDSSTVQSLDGESSVTDTLTVTSADGTAHRDIVISIDGADDAASFSGDVSGHLVEDAADTASGVLTVHDADSGQDHFQAVGSAALVGHYGQFTFDSSSGEWTYQVNNQVQSLGAGDSVTDALTVTSADGTHQDIVVTIDGVNDAPWQDSVALDAVAEDTPAGAIAGATVFDLFNSEFSDIDRGSSLAGVAVTANLATVDQGAWQYKTPASGIWEDVGSPDPAHALAFSANTLLRFVPAHDFSGAPGSLEVHAIDNTYDEEFTTGFDTGGGRYTINLTDSGTDPLGHGGSTPFSDQPASLGTSVTPVNDAPLYSGEDLAPIYHAGDGPVALVHHVSASDVDSANYGGGTLTATVTDGGHEGDTLSIVNNQYITIDTGSNISFDSDGDGDAADPVTIGALSNYDYNSLTVSLYGNASDAAVAALTEAIEFSNSLPYPVADTRTVTFTLQDGGGIANGGHDLTRFETKVTVPAANHPATIAGDATGQLVEDATASGVPLDTFSDVLVVYDVDPGENHFAPVDPAALDGTYGQFTFNSINGQWSYHVDSATVQQLGASDHVTDTLTVASADGTAHQDIIVTIDGSNDAPVFNGVASAPAYHAGDGKISFVGNVSASDIDSANYAGGTLTATVTNGGHEGDTLSIEGNQFISLIVSSGTTVMYDADGDSPGPAVAIGTLSDNINSLTVHLNGNATDTAIAKLTEAIEFSNFTANPAAGTRTVTFTLQDGGGTANGGHDSDLFVATVGVPAVQPVAHADAFSTDQDVAASLGILQNDDGAANAAIVVGPAHGSLTHNPDGSVTYTPDAGFVGTDGFTYSASTAETTDNLIFNPGAELGSSVDDAIFGPTPVGWTNLSGYITSVSYTADGGFNMGAVGGPIGGGHAFFAGGPTGAINQIEQTIDVTSFAGDIDAGTMTANLSGYLGGFATQDDNITVTAHFLGAGSTELGTLSIGPVLAADRVVGGGAVSTLIYSDGSVAVPVGTQFIELVVTSTRTAGTYNDGYADNLSLTLSHGGLQSTPTTVNVDVNAVPHDATIDGDSTGHLVEDATVSGSLVPFDTVSGVLTVHDVDSDENHFAAVDPDALLGTYGQFTFDRNSGEWSYQVDTAGIQSLGATDSVTDTLTVYSADGTAHQDIVVTVDGINDAPVLADDEALHFNPIFGSEVDNEGQTVASLLGSDVTDPDGPAAGIAIIDSEVSSLQFGHWQYRLDSGGDWSDFNASDVSALLLGVDDHVRFVPNNGHTNHQSLTFRAWDGSAGAAGDSVDIQASGTGGSTPFSSRFNTADIEVTASGPDAPPVVGGDMAILTVKGGHEVALTTTDLNAIDPDTDPSAITFTVDNINHGLLTFGPGRTTLEVDDTFTLADIQAGRVFYQSVDDYVGSDHITLTLSDGVAGTPTSVVKLGATIVDAQFTVQAPGGYFFDQDDPIVAMGSTDTTLSDVTPTTFTIYNADANRNFIFTGADFAYDGDDHVFRGGIITSIQEVLANESQTPIATFDLSVPVVDWLTAVAAKANGDNSLIEALTRPWTFNFIGNSGADGFGASNVNDIFTGRGGNDSFEGDFGYDRANYGGATGPIDVQLAAGIVTGTGVNASGVGTDTLNSIELVTGSNYDDTFDATGFSAISQNAGSTVTNNVAGMFNEFEGRGGTDTITGNSQTRISYYHATAGVTVTFDSHSWDGFVTPGAPGNLNPVGGASGIATGDVSVGTDHFTGVNQVRGSFFDDHFTGSNNPSGTSENFEGLGGDDFIDGGGGFDRAAYFQAADDTGITVNLAAGTVVGGIDTGTDTLRSVEAIWGTNFADTYNAAGFTGSAASQPSVNNGNSGNPAVNGGSSSFNEFEGGAGDDTVTGNNNTRVYFGHSTGGVVVTLDPGTNGTGTTGAGTAAGNDTVGHDTFLGGVTRVRGSEFNDIIKGNGADNILEGQGGNDIINGKGGNDTETGGTGSDIFVYAAGGGADAITDFNRSQGDRIDLRGVPGIYSMADVLPIAAQSGPATVLTFSPGNSIALQNVLLGSLAATDFIFAGEPGFVSEMSSEGNLGTRSEHVLADGGTHPATITPVFFNMQINPAAPGVLTIIANDVENPQQSGAGPSGELDNVYINGHLVGQLTQGVDGADTSTSFTITPSMLFSQINPGVLLSEFNVQVNNVNSTTGWNFTVASASYLSASNGFTSSIVPDDVQRQNGSTPAGDIGVRAAWTAGHADTFTLALAASGTFSNVALTIHANDVELPGTPGGMNGEIDQVFVNGHAVGFLTQAPDTQNSTTVLSVDPSFLLHGNNVVTVYNVNQNVDPASPWNFQVDSLSFAGGISTAAAATSPSVAVTVQTPDGYDFSTLYADLAAGYPGLADGDFAASNTDTHMFLVDAARGITFELIGTGFAYNGEHLATGGTITEIDILGTVLPDDPAQLTQDHVLVNSNGWSIAASSLVGYLGLYDSQSAELHNGGLSGLNGIFGASTYNYVGSAGFSDNDSNSHDGTDVFVGGSHGDVFNGRPGPFGGQDPGSDTVDYSGAGSAVSVNLLTGATAGVAASGDTFISIENLRGTSFNDVLTGDGNNNVIEGGPGNDVLDGGGNGIGSDIASYEHATDYVTVDLRSTAQQNTHGAGLDTLSHFEGVRSSAFDDTLIGNGSSILEGGGGNDRLIGQSDGHDTASYEHATAGVTVDLNYQGGDSQNTHGAGLDTLTNIANVSGSQFNDTLIGDSHDNIFFGNGGHDTFVFGSTTGHDTIGDFSTGGDKIDLGYTVPSDPTNSAVFDHWLSSMASTVGNDTLIDLDPHPDLSHPGSNTVLLQNVYMGNLQASDFVAHASFGF